MSFQNNTLKVAIADFTFIKRILISIASKTYLDAFKCLDANNPSILQKDGRIQQSSLMEFQSVAYHIVFTCTRSDL